MLNIALKDFLKQKNSVFINLNNYWVDFARIIFVIHKVRFQKKVRKISFCKCLHFII